MLEHYFVFLSKWNQLRTFSGSSQQRLGPVQPALTSDLSVCVAQMDLMPFVNKAGCECLNESDDCGFDNCLIKDSSCLESDCDEQVTSDPE